MGAQGQHWRRFESRCMKTHEFLVQSSSPASAILFSRRPERAHLARASPAPAPIRHRHRAVAFAQRPGRRRRRRRWVAGTRGPQPQPEPGVRLGLGRLGRLRSTPLRAEQPTPKRPRQKGRPALVYGVQCSRWRHRVARGAGVAPSAHGGHGGRAGVRQGRLLACRKVPGQLRVFLVFSELIDFMFHTVHISWYLVGKLLSFNFFHGIFTECV